ncbi:MAG: TetR family transcriptional regulator [Flavobacteriaceae bacterium]
MARTAAGTSAKAATKTAAKRRQAVGEHKRALILDAARRVFEREGLEGASLRAIAAEAGYTPAALYFHFDSKEAVYADLLTQSIDRLREAVDRAVAGAKDAPGRLEAAALAFFGFYALNPRDLDLGFYLFRGGMKPRGLGRERNRLLNASFYAALEPVESAAVEMGAEREAARRLAADILAHAAGLLLIAHTGRIRLFGASAEDLMRGYVAERVALLG